MDRIKLLVRDWIPPIIMREIQKRRGNCNSFEVGSGTWEETIARCTGYDADHILTKVLEATLKVRRGEAAYERDSVLFDEIEYSWPVTAGLMWAAARCGGNLNVLDFGGALGSSYFQNRKFIDTLPDVRWNIVEQSHYVLTGQKFIQDERLRFYESIDQCFEHNRPNVILFSSVLQYLKNPMKVIEKISKSDIECLLIDKTPFSNLKDDKILIQKVPECIYSASYPMWTFSKEKFFKSLLTDWKIITDYINPEGTVKTNNGLSLTFQGLLLEQNK